MPDVTATRGTDSWLLRDVKLAPAPIDEATTPRRELGVIGWDLYSRDPEVNIERGDLVSISGTTHEVVSDPERWPLGVVARVRPLTIWDATCTITRATSEGSYAGAGIYSASTTSTVYTGGCQAIFDEVKASDLAQGHTTQAGATNAPVSTYSVRVPFEALPDDVIEITSGTLDGVVLVAVAAGWDAKREISDVECRT